MKFSTIAACTLSLTGTLVSALAIPRVENDFEYEEKRGAKWDAFKSGAKAVGKAALPIAQAAAPAILAALKRSPDFEFDDEYEKRDLDYEEKREVEAAAPVILDALRRSPEFDFEEYETRDLDFEEKRGAKWDAFKSGAKAVGKAALPIAQAAAPAILAALKRSPEYEFAEAYEKRDLDEVAAPVLLDVLRRSPEFDFEEYEPRDLDFEEKRGAKWDAFKSGAKAVGKAALPIAQAAAPAILAALKRSPEYAFAEAYEKRDFDFGQAYEKRDFEFGDVYEKRGLDFDFDDLYEKRGLEFNFDDLYE